MRAVMQRFGSSGSSADETRESLKSTHSVDEVIAALSAEDGSGAGAGGGRCDRLVPTPPGVRQILLRGWDSLRSFFDVESPLAAGVKPAAAYTRCACMHGLTNCTRQLAPGPNDPVWLHSRRPTTQCPNSVADLPPDLRAQVRTSKVLGAARPRQPHANSPRDITPRLAQLATSKKHSGALPPNAQVRISRAISRPVSLPGPWRGTPSPSASSGMPSPGRARRRRAAARRRSWTTGSRLSAWSRCRAQSAGRKSRRNQPRHNRTTLSLGV